MTLAMFRSSKLIFSLFLLSWTLVQAQTRSKKPLGNGKKAPVKRGPDGRPLLFGPDIEKCKTSKSFLLPLIQKETMRCKEEK